MSRPFPNLIPWFAARLCSNVAKQMLTTVIAWRVYELTRDPLALGLIGLAEALPYVTFSLWAGTIVDRQEKRRFMLLADGGLLAGGVVLLLLMRRSAVPLGVLYGVVFWMGICRSIGHTAASSYLQTIIPSAHFPRVAAWNLLQYQTSMVGGPLLGGWILSAWGMQAATAGVVLFWIAAVAFTAALPRLPTALESISTENTWRQMVAGLRFIRSQPLIYGPMALDMVSVLLGDAIALYPMFADRLGAGPLGLGILRASPAIGSGLLSAVQSVRPFVPATWRALKTTIVVFGVCMIAFAVSPYLVVATAFLIAAGAADGMSVIIRQSLYQGLTPNHLRGRVSSVNGIFVVASNEIGAFESGLAARLFGLVPSVVGGALLTLLSVVVIGRAFGDLDRFRARKGSTGG